MAAVPDRRIAAVGLWAGLLVAPVYFSLVGVLGALEPGFSHLTDMMSLLGGVPGARGMMFNAGVMLTGAMLILFAIALRARLAVSRARSIATTLMVLGGLGTMGGGVFACTEGCVNVIEAPDTIGILHGLAAFMAGVGTGISLFFYWRAMARDPAWQGFARVTLFAALIVNGAGILFWIELATGLRMPAIDGLLQRIGFAGTLIWAFFVALRMRRG